MQRYANQSTWFQGFDEDEDGNNLQEIFQFYIIDDNGAKMLQELTDEILFYNEELDMWLLAVTHYGTNWSYVCSGIPLVLDKK